MMWRHGGAVVSTAIGFLGLNPAEAYLLTLVRINGTEDEGMNECSKHNTLKSPIE